MKTLSKAIAIASLVSASALTAQVANAGVEYNVAATSNYVWRGDTQSSNMSAFSGGVDYAHDSGLSAGVWTSNTSGDTEVDYYAAFGTEVAGFGLSAGAIAYDYNDDTADFVEVNVGAEYMGASLSYSVKVDDGDTNKDNDDAAYISVGYGMDAAEDISVAVAFGQTIDASKASSDADKYDYMVAATKSLPEFDFTLAWTNKESGENDLVVTASKSF